MGRTIGIILSAIILGASLLAAPWGAPLTLGSGLSWAGIAAQGVGLATQIAAKATEKVNPELSKTLSITGWAISLAGTLMSAVGTGMRRADFSKFKVARSQSVPPNSSYRNFVANFYIENTQWMPPSRLGGWSSATRTDILNQYHNSASNSFSSSISRSSPRSSAESIEFQNFTPRNNQSSNTNAQLPPDQQASGSSSDENRDYQGVVRKLGVSAPKTQSYT